MEKVKVSIIGHDFNLKTDAPDRLKSAAAELQKRINRIGDATLSNMSLTDIVMLAALDIADNAEETKASADDAKRLEEELSKANRLIKDSDEAAAKLAECEKTVKELKAQNDEFSKQIDKLKSENKALSDKTEELNKKLSIASPENALKADKQLIDGLKAEKAELAEKNKKLENKLAQLETSWNNLKKDYNRSHKIGEGSVGMDAQQIQTLKETVATYEKTFDQYVKQRNSEVAELNEELNTLRKKYDELNRQMSEIVNDGQMTL